MRSLPFVAVLGLAALVPATASAQQCVWGSFDGSRINYGDGPLTGAAHSTFRNIIQANGGTIAPATPTLTPAYLGTVDVFYTSMLSSSSGALSPAEQTALQNWIAAGGTLIVTVEYSPLPAYNAMMAPYNVSFVKIAQQGTASVVANHPITTSVTTIKFAAESEVVSGNDALLLAQGPTQKDFAVVLEAASGFGQAGRILVFGDHNMFTDSYIQQDHNVQLAQNMVIWACTGGCPGFFQQYGAACSAPSGTPNLKGGGCPTPTDQISLQLSGALPGATTFVLFGLGQASVPISPSCSLANGPVAPAPVLTLPAGPTGGWTLSGVIPAAATTPADVYLQAVVLDPNAPFGLSASNGLRLHLDA